MGRAAPNRLHHYADTAYVAMRNAVPRLDCVTSIRRRPGEGRTLSEGTSNRAHSRIRISYQNAIQKVNVFWIMEMYRNRLKEYDVINDIVCGLVDQAILLKRDGLL